MAEADKKSIIIAGAGPAGLTAAYELSKLGETSIIFEASDQVGGISKTVDYKGNRFDIGGHRFFSKVPYVNQLWEEILGDEFLTCERLSRIHYNGIFFDYPLKPAKALLALGPIEAVRIGYSYAKVMVFPSTEKETSFEQWVVNRFGYRLFSIFFKTYTEKVWGMPCDEISSDWAAQRIKNLSLKEALKSALLNPKRKNGDVITSLIEQFKYPRLGPGMMWEHCQEFLDQNSSPTFFKNKVVELKHEDEKILHVVTEDDTNQKTIVPGDYFISSIPLRELIYSLNPLPPDKVLEAAAKLKYRDYLTVVLIIDRKDVFPDNWIYIHTPEVKLGRIQNYKNWSGHMVENENYTTLGLEYFLWEKDEEWVWADEKLIELGVKECVQIGIIKTDEVIDSTVVRMKKAYPVYDHAYTSNLKILKNYIQSFKNLQTIGRNGQHRYNNQDHSMMTGVYAARNILGADYNIWSVNVEKEYLEKDSTKSDINDRLTPHLKKETKKNNEEVIINELFTNLDPVALGGAIGVTSVILLGMATIVVLLKADQEIVSILNLLSNYLIGFSVSWSGLFIGLIEILAVGYSFGYLLAWLRNRIFKIFIWNRYKKISRDMNRDIIEKI